MVGAILALSITQTFVQGFSRRDDSGTGAKRQVRSLTRRVGSRLNFVDPENGTSDEDEIDAKGNRGNMPPGTAGSHRIPPDLKIGNFSEIIWHPRTSKASELQILWKLIVAGHIFSPIFRPTQVHQNRFEKRQI